MKSLADFIGILLSRGGFFLLLCSSAFMLQVWRLDLLHGTAITFLGVVAAWGVLWVVYTFRVGRIVSVFPLLFLGWVTFEATLPGSAKALRTQAGEVDHRVQELIGTIDETTATTISPPPHAPVQVIESVPTSQPMPTQQTETVPVVEQHSPGRQPITIVDPQLQDRTGRKPVTIRKRQQR